MDKPKKFLLRLTPAQREKLARLAMGEGCSMTAVITNLIDRTPTHEVTRTVNGLAFLAQKNSGDAQIVPSRITAVQ